MSSIFSLSLKSESDEIDVSLHLKLDIFESPKVNSSLTVADEGCAFLPIVVTLAPVVSVQPEQIPIAVLKEPVVFAPKAA